MNPTSPPKIFISYSRSDIRFAKKISSALKKSGGQIWHDVEQIQPGDYWPKLTLDKLKESDYVIIILSQQSVKSKGFVTREFIAAAEEMKNRSGKYIIPFKADDCKIPTYFAKLHVVSQRNNGIAQLVKATGLEPKPKKKLYEYPMFWGGLLLLIIMLLLLVFF